MVRNEQPLLFDSLDDPGQRENLALREPSTLAEMQALLRHSLTDLAAPPDLFERLSLAPGT
jgi:hypothetical protein